MMPSIAVRPIVSGWNPAGILATAACASAFLWSNCLGPPNERPTPI
jgi:hypothetical protein